MTGPADPPQRWHHRFDNFAADFNLLRKRDTSLYELQTTLAGRS